MSIQNQQMLARQARMVREPTEPEWKSWSPDNKPPFKWEDPTIRFWRDVLKRPLPPVNDDPHMQVKWEPLIRGMHNNRNARMKAAVLLEYQARLLRNMTDYDNNTMTMFAIYLRSNKKEQAWFRVGGQIEESFNESMKQPPEEPGGVGIFLKYLFPVIRWRCNIDELTEFVEKVFEDRGLDTNGADAQDGRASAHPGR